MGKYWSQKVFHQFNAPFLKLERVALVQMSPFQTASEEPRNGALPDATLRPAPVIITTFELGFISKLESSGRELLPRVDARRLAGGGEGVDAGAGAGAGASFAVGADMLV